jgi:hypothetical protein
LLACDWPDTRYSENGPLIKIISTGLRSDLPQPGWEYWSTVGVRRGGPGTKGEYVADW